MTLLLLKQQHRISCIGNIFSCFMLIAMSAALFCLKARLFKWSIHGGCICQLLGQFFRIVGIPTSWPTLAHICGKTSCGFVWSTVEEEVSRWPQFIKQIRNQNTTFAGHLSHYGSSEWEADCIHVSGNTPGPRIPPCHASSQVRWIIIISWKFNLLEMDQLTCLLQNASGYQGSKYSPDRKCGCQAGRFWSLCSGKIQKCICIYERYIKVLELRRSENIKGWAILIKRV